MLTYRDVRGPVKTVKTIVDIHTPPSEHTAAGKNTQTHNIQTHSRNLFVCRTHERILTQFHFMLIYTYAQSRFLHWHFKSSATTCTYFYVYVHIDVHAHDVIVPVPDSDCKISHLNSCFPPFNSHKNHITIFLDKVKLVICPLVFVFFTTVLM